MKCYIYILRHKIIICLWNNIRTFFLVHCFQVFWGFICRLLKNSKWMFPKLSTSSWTMILADLNVLKFETDFLEEEISSPDLLKESPSEDDGFSSTNRRTGRGKQGTWGIPEDVCQRTWGILEDVRQLAKCLTQFCGIDRQCRFCW